MSNINHCIFTGRLTAAPELKQTQSGKNVCSFSMAVESGWGENKKVCYPNLVAWNGQAEFVSKLQKGSKSRCAEFLPSVNGPIRTENIRCKCADCSSNASLDGCDGGYCIYCFECMDAKEPKHDVYLCTGYKARSVDNG